MSAAMSMQQMQQMKGGGPAAAMMQQQQQQQQDSSGTNGGGGGNPNNPNNNPNSMMGTKQLLGERLYPAVARLQPELAGKITGMMLEMSPSEVMGMLENEAHLRQKVGEAVRVLGMATK